MRIPICQTVFLLLISSPACEPFAGTRAMATHAQVHKKRQPLIDTQLVSYNDAAIDGEDVIDEPVIPEALYEADPNDQRYSVRAWWQNLRTLPRSSILRAIRPPVAVITAWATLLSIIHKTLAVKGFKGLAAGMCLNSKPHSMLVSALGLLLVFRTNSAYQRFTEGRKIWEKILSVSRNMSRLGSLYERDIGRDRTQRVSRLLAAFPYLLRHHIQPQCLTGSEKEDATATCNAILLHDPSREAIGLGQRAGRVVREHSHTIGGQPSTHDCWVDRRSLPWCLFPGTALNKMSAASNRPLWVCDRLSREITNVAYTTSFTSRERLALLGLVDKLSQSIGECERIHQTAVPLNYARHSLRSLSLWLITLPFALVGDLGLLTGPAMATISWLLLGVYQIGYNIEDPFQGSLQLSVLCDAVYRDVMYGISDDPQKQDPRKSAFELKDEMMEWSMLQGPMASSGASTSESNDALLLEQGEPVGYSSSYRM